MKVAAVVGVDIGTSSSKGVLVDLDGRVIRSSTREHDVDRHYAMWPLDQIDHVHMEEERH